MILKYYHQINKLKVELTDPKQNQKNKTQMNRSAHQLTFIYTYRTRAEFTDQKLDQQIKKKTSRSTD